MNTFRIIERTAGEPFEATLSLQQNLVEAKVADRSLSDFVVFVEHAPVYTVGRSVPFQRPAGGKFREIDWVEVGRGGQATYPGPGQLVVYPVFDLTRHGKDVHKYLRSLERVGIYALSEFGFSADTRSDLTGVWVRDRQAAWRKVASLGIGVRKWVSYHGVAVNVSTDLDYFRAIEACGQEGEVVSSIAQLAEQSPGFEVPSIDSLKGALVRAFEREFKMELESVEAANAPRRRPPWLKVRAPGSPEFLETRKVVKDLSLVTVCEEAHCPNIGECWSHHTATFMVMGELCTRRCSFCACCIGGW